MKKSGHILLKIGAVVLAVLIAACCAWGIWQGNQPKFHDLTVANSDPVPQISAFLTDYAKAEKAAFVTDIAALCGGPAGEYQVTLRHGNREETVTLTVEDTLPPELTLQDRNVSGMAQLKPEDFVLEAWDHGEVTLRFEEEPVIPENYEDLTVTIVAADAYGNETTAQCVASFAWMKAAVQLEYGQSLSPADLLYNPDKDAALISDEDLQMLNSAPVGTYTVSSTMGGKTLECVVTIQDTQGPVLELQEHQVYLNGFAQLEDFVVSASDVSGDVELRMMSQPDFTVEGTYTIVIEAEDIYGNITTAQTVLYVATDTQPPVITGAEEPLTVDKYSQPDYLDGMSAEDAKDGEVEVTVDAGMVDTSLAGDYYITYSAKDKSGNVASVRRKVTVQHDEEDTLALVRSIAEQLEDDPEKIRDYVRSSISYNTNWGGDDPVWHGFQFRSGNCYVHALCLKALLDEKGYNTQLIWVMDETHYWLIIEIEPGVWRHIDATPGSPHNMISLMTDGQRYYTLDKRNWDRSKWPACE